MKERCKKGSLNVNRKKTDEKLQMSGKKRNTREKNTQKPKHRGSSDSNNNKNNNHKNHCRVNLYEHLASLRAKNERDADGRKKKLCDCKYEKRIHCALNDDGGKNSYKQITREKKQQQQQSPIITTSNPLNKLSLDNFSQNDTDKKQNENKKTRRTK